jgi:hypothetical protein
MFGFMQLPSPEAPTAPPERTPLVTSLLDTAIRFGLWGALLVGVAEPLRRQPLEQILPVLLIFGIIGAGYLLLSTDGVARALRVSGQSHPLLMALPPLLLLVPVMPPTARVPRRWTFPMRWPPSSFLPPALALINTPACALDAGVGPVAVAAPLTLALAAGRRSPPPMPR